MTRMKSAPVIPAQWSRYIKSHAGKYATGMFAREDAEQVATLAFLSARTHFKPGKGDFDRYARVSIRNALLNARRAERKHWDQRESSEAEHQEDDGLPHWAGEETVLETIDDMAVVTGIQCWADALPPKLAPIWQALYTRDLSQREYALEVGVSQPRISQLHSLILDHARSDLVSRLNS